MNNVSIPDKRSLCEERPARMYPKTGTARECAYHEAGHATISRLVRDSLSSIVLGSGVGAVIQNGRDITSDLEMIRRKDKALYKSMHVLAADDPLCKPLAIRTCCILLAGLQAEMLLDEVELDGPIIREDSDHIRARETLSHAFGTDCNLYYPQMVTRFYLARCWHEVVRTAETLLVRHAEQGIGIINRDNPGDALFFSKDLLGVAWVDEAWS